jgi:hypothetical protein
MGALTLIPSSSLPPARAALVALNRRIVDADRALATLVRGRDQLRAELSRADVARNELDTLINEDASSLAGKMRAGVSWTLAHFGSAKAMNLVAALSESQIQLGVGTKALMAIDADIAIAEREVSDLKSSKDDLVRSVLVESAGGIRTDLLTALDHVREAITTLVALHRVTAHSDGSYRPNARIVIEIPALGTMPAQAVISPESCIERAQSIWLDYSSELHTNPLADIENIHFPLVVGNEDDGRILYHNMTATERAAADQNRSQGVK